MFTSNCPAPGTRPGCPRQHHCHRARRLWRCTGACMPGNRFSRGFTAAGNSSRTHGVFTNFCLGGDVMARPPAPPPVGTPRAQPTRGNSPRCTLLVARPAKHLNLNWPHDRLVVVTPTASTRPARMDASLRAHGVVVTQRRNIITSDAQRPNHTAPAPPRHRRRRPGQCCQMPAKTRSVPMQGIEPPSVERLFWQKVPTELPTKSKVTPLVPTPTSTPATPSAPPSKAGTLFSHR